MRCRHDILFRPLFYPSFQRFFRSKFTTVLLFSSLRSLYHSIHIFSADSCIPFAILCHCLVYNALHRPDSLPLHYGFMNRNFIFISHCFPFLGCCFFCTLPLIMLPCLDSFLTNLLPFVNELEYLNFLTFKYNHFERTNTEKYSSSLRNSNRLQLFFVSLVLFLF